MASTMIKTNTGQLTIKKQIYENMKNKDHWKTGWNSMVVCCCCISYSHIDNVVGLGYTQPLTVKKLKISWKGLKLSDWLEMQNTWFTYLKVLTVIENYYSSSKQKITTCFPESLHRNINILVFVHNYFSNRDYLYQIWTANAQWLEKEL